jgi:hypothetical protein
MSDASTEFSLTNEFANEFGGRWEDHQGTLIGHFEAGEKSYIELLSALFKRRNTPYETATNSQGQITFSFENIGHVTEMACDVCDKFRDPTRQHITVRKLLTGEIPSDDFSIRKVLEEHAAANVLPEERKIYTAQEQPLQCVSIPQALMFLNQGSSADWRYDRLTDSFITGSLRNGAMDGIRKWLGEENIPHTGIGNKISIGVFDMQPVLERTEIHAVVGDVDHCGRIHASAKEAIVLS